MCNCGNKSNDYATSGSFVQNNRKEETQKASAVQDSYFEYTGKTDLTVTRNVSGKRYRYSEPGDKQLIYFRDVAGMMRVPVLRLMQENIIQ
ncbi:MAG: hypothetical protein H7334_03420 [Ferruginibacter sp.]|nr:hypothetical protein [Ferruginibacter sp.]